MKQARQTSAFKSEAEEPEWWYANRSQPDKDFAEATRAGTLKRLDPAELKARLSSSARSRVVSLRLPEDDIALARQQAMQRGLPYQTYIKSVLYQALRSQGSW